MNNTETLQTNYQTVLNDAIFWDKVYASTWLMLVFVFLPIIVIFALQMFTFGVSFFIFLLFFSLLISLFIYSKNKTILIYEELFSIQKELDALNFIAKEDQ
ncbi:hypothetical protein [Sulfurimonas sp.]|uniref:hypothetical protein n=1 Tax=Sulfurimonas sp. TaxID=2022749 RepID=UPI003D10A022